MLVRNKINLIISCFFIWSACSQETQPPSLQKKTNSVTPSYANIIDSCSHLLQTGDIVLRLGNDVISELFAALNVSDHSFSHCGIVFQENNEWVVYHSIGGEDNPDAAMRREKFSFFVRSAENKAFGICRYQLQNNQIERLHQKVQEWYKQKIPFDMQFNLQSNHRLYCAEMLFKAYNYACKTNSFFETTNHKGFIYVSTDNIYMNKHAQLLCHVVY